MVIGRNGADLRSGCDTGQFKAHEPPSDLDTGPSRREFSHPRQNRPQVQPARRPPVTPDLAPHRVSAFNIAASSENKIHDDAVAARFGFAGGLVPGVAVWGYMAHLPVARWGRRWLEAGRGDCRFLDPVYDGCEAVASARSEGDELVIEIESGGRRCASGRASLPDTVIAAPTLPGERAPPPPSADERPPASEHSLAEGLWLAIRPITIDDADALQWLDDLRETDPIYRRERLTHPATLLRVANAVLVQNVRLGPWIHVGSTVQNHAAIPWGAAVGAEARVVRNHEHKGHRFVELDILVTIDGEKVAAQVAHTAIWLPRQVAEPKR